MNYDAFDTKTKLKILDWIEDGLFGQLRNALAGQSYYALIRHLENKQKFDIRKILSRIPDKFLEHMEHCEESIEIINAERRKLETELEIEADDEPI